MNGSSASPVSPHVRVTPARYPHRFKLSSCLLLTTVLAAILVTVALAPPAYGATPTDDFNRSNGPLGPNWTAMTDGALAISSQAVVGTVVGGYSGAIRTAEAYSSDQSSDLQITAPQLSGSQQIGVGVRAQNGGKTLYFGSYARNNGSPQLRLYKRVNGTWTQLVTYQSGVLAANTILRLSVKGSTLIVWTNSSAKIRTIDRSITGGAPAIMAFGTPNADNWHSGGNTTDTPTYSVGGTVTGLSGTLVLRNNGGDDLALTANGVFTFATRLQAGYSYAVTVKTNPTGQTCTVTNGTGTMGTANVTNVAVACNLTGGNPTDDFNRADGGLGPNWSTMIDGAMAISGQTVVGTRASNYSGNIRTAETYASDQTSQLQITGTQLSGGQWIGVGVRAQASGLNLYLGLYFWNSGNPVLMLFERNNGAWIQLGATYASGALAAGTQLRLSAVGSTITFSQNGVARITVTDTTLTGGAPAIMAFDTPTADNWQGTGSTGIAPTYSVEGTVSGLTGSVVLQNNSGDDLTVPADGPFTFATRLQSGASYSVTVKTNPTGQSCTVTNPTGTIGSANVTNIAVACTTFTVGSGQVTDDFNRADGGLGSNWSPTIDGAMAISGQAVVGTKANNYSGNMRTAETYANDQSSQLQLTTQLSGGQWIGVGVRGQNNGLNLYLGLYWWNSGNPVLMLFERNNGTWTQIAATYQSGALAAGTQLQLSAVGSTLTFSQNGVARITATDTTLAGGVPAIMAFDAPTADNWQGAGATGIAPSYSVGGTVSGLTGNVVLQDNGADDLTVSANGPFTFPTQLRSGASYSVTVRTQPSTGQTCTVANGAGTVTSNVTSVGVTCAHDGFSVQFVSKDANGVEHYSVLSPNDGPDQQTLRILRPTHPAVGVAHNFLYALPVEPGEQNTYGDPMSTLAALDAQDQYNLTIVVPSFETQPWYANDALDSRHQYETYMTSELQPWVRANLATTGQEQHWLIGFSKSGIGGEDLILKHPDVFTLVASWDFPADMSTYTEYGADNYGTDANFQSNYRLTPAFVDARKAPLTTNNRIWIGGYQVFQQDVTDYDALLTSEGIQHTLGPMQAVAHRWDSGWVAGALAGLAQDSVNLH